MSCQMLPRRRKRKPQLDSVSFFLEWEGGGEFVLERFFFQRESFATLFLETERSLDELDFVVDEKTMDAEDCLVFLQKLSTRCEGEPSRKIQTFISGYEAFDLAGNRSFVEIRDRYQRFADAFNEALFGLCYSFDSRSLVEDGCANAAENIIADYRSLQPTNDIPLFGQPSFWADERNSFELRIYNVGQANCSALVRKGAQNNYKILAVFDFGFQTAKGRNKDLEEMISKIDSDTTIVLSHFHRDHFNNLLNHRGVHPGKWILPNYLSPTSRCSKSLAVLLKLVLSGPGSVYVLSSFSCILPGVDLFSHSSKPKMDAYQTSLANAWGIVTSLTGKRNNVILPGDALYSEISSALPVPPSKYDVILLPHHGCFYREFQTQPSSRFIRSDTLGVVPCGTNHYGHASISHLALYDRLFLFCGSSLYGLSAKTPVAKVTNNKKGYYAIPL